MRTRRCSAFCLPIAVLPVAVLPAAVLLIAVPTTDAAPAGRGRDFSAPTTNANINTVDQRSAYPSYLEPEAAPALDPRQVILAKAMARAKQRAERMAARDWYGFRPSRPPAMPTPLVGTGAFGGRPAMTAPPRPTILFYR